MKDEQFAILCMQNKNLADMLSLLNQRLDLLNDGIQKQNDVLMSVLTVMQKNMKEST